MGSALSVETLFWAPLGMDLMLLVGTYSACKVSGLGWFLNEMKKHSEKKNDDGDEEIDKLVKTESHPIHSVWDLAMTAYSAYGCVSLKFFHFFHTYNFLFPMSYISSSLSLQLLPWATYVSCNDPSLRVSLSWAMTTLMVAKLSSPNAWKWTNTNGEKGKVLTIIFFYLPTYGGYAAYKSFFSS